MIGKRDLTLIVIRKHPYSSLVEHFLECLAHWFPNNNINGPILRYALMVSVYFHKSFSLEVEIVIFKAPTPTA